MREFSVPALVEVDPASNLTDLVVENAVQAPHTAVFARQLQGRWQDVTARQFLSEVSAVAKGLIASGVQPGDRVGLMSTTRYEWTLCDFAIWFAGAITVPIYETSSAEQVAWIVNDSGAVACLTETAAHTATVEQIRERCPDLREVWSFDAGAIDHLQGSGAGVSDDDLEDRRQRASLSDIATVIYTSGTTGRPKGCELTHGNFVELCRNTTARLTAVLEADGASTLLFLPLAHVFARLIQVLCVTSRARLAHTPDVKNLVADLGTYKPTFILSVPRVFEKIYNGSEQKAEAGGKGRIFRAAAEVAVAYSRAQDQGGAGLRLRLQHAVFDKLVYGKLREALGGNITYAVSGGAPLGPRLGHFYRGIGLVVLEGYGLTETTAPTAVNTPELIKIGTVGPPLPGTSVRIADDGEVLIKGVHVFAGYWGNEEATAEAMQDGWFHTGDLGTLDDDGFLTITGRKKEIIVTSGGKNVAPAMLEDRLRAHPLVSQCLVVGDQRPYIAALVTLDAEMAPVWAANNGKEGLTLDQLAADQDVLAEVQRAVDDANTQVSQAESVRRFQILTTDFTVENGYLTPSMKLKRNVVTKDFADRIEALYAG